MDDTCVTRFFGILFTLYELVDFVFFLITKEFFHNAFYIFNVLALFVNLVFSLITLEFDLQCSSVFDFCVAPLLVNFVCYFVN